MNATETTPEDLDTVPEPEGPKAEAAVTLLRLPDGAGVQIIFHQPEDPEAGVMRAPTFSDLLSIETEFRTFLENQRLKSVLAQAFGPAKVQPARGGIVEFLRRRGR